MCNLCTILYYLVVWICVQRIMITLLNRHKYSAPPETPMKLVADATYRRPHHFKIQWCRYQSVSCYRQPNRPILVLSGHSDPSFQSGLSLQTHFSHTVKFPKGLTSPSNFMILMPHLKINTMNPSLIQLPLTYISLFRPCTALVFPSVLS